MVKPDTFSHLRSFRALVLGDFLLDSYTTGRVKRISPEAPVPVMEVLSQEMRPGGAGNVVLNLAAIGAHVTVVGRTGDDVYGHELKRRLEKAGASTRPFLIEPDYKTPLKNRLIADNQQLLRIDHEAVTPLIPKIEAELISQLERLILDSEIIALSDYGKGFLTPNLISAAVALSRKHRIPLIIDPKGTDFTKYKGAYLIKPNLSEAYAAANLPSSAPLDTVARCLLDQTEADLLLITRSSQGMSLFDRQGTQVDFPVRAKEVIDVTGAGDTVLAFISMALATGIDIQTGAQLANVAAGIAIERIGCVQVTLPDLAHRLLEFTCETKIFDESHIYALRQVLTNKRYSLLTIDAETDVLSIARGARHLQNKDLVVYLSYSNPSEEFVHLLSSLREIDYILLHKLQSFCASLRPEERYTIRDGHLLVDTPVYA